MICNSKTSGALLLQLLFGLSCSFHVKRCPHRSDGLQRWSDLATWPNRQEPAPDSSVIIDKPILLDKSSLTLFSIDIRPGGYLIFDKKEINLKVHWIRINGEMHIGGEQCKMTKKIKITFVGDLNQANETGLDKGLYVEEDGVLEVHGEDKLSWTKLIQTAYKPLISKGNAVVEQLNTNNVNWDEKAMLAYHISPTTGEVIMEDYFVFSTREIDAQENMQRFGDFIDSIPNGNIVGLAILRKIDKSNKIDLSVFENKVAELAYGNSGAPTTVRDIVSPGAYVLLTQKGDYSSTVESYVNEVDSNENTASVSKIFGHNVRVYIKSFTANQLEKNYVKLIVQYGSDMLNPKLDLIDDATSWKEGDEIVIASTDFDWRQAEVRTVHKCSDCAPNQIRINEPLDYTHYGNIYKNVDMRAEVGLLTRKVVFDSEDASDAVGYGGHLKFTQGFKSVRVEGAELTNLGAPQFLGRYSLHFHMCRDVYGKQYLRKNSIHHANTRCVTIHGSHNCTVQDNVCYLTRGHSYFLEDGGERDTLLVGNLGLGTQTGTLLLSDQIEPTTFWITNPNTIVRDNVAAGSDLHGIWFVYPDEPLALSKGLGFMELKEARYTTIKEFKNNVAHSCVKFGLNIDNILKENEVTTGYNLWIAKEDPVMHAKYANSTNKETILEQFTGYKNGERNTWIRGGWITMRKSSMSDSLINSVLIRQTTDNEHFFRESVIVGNSDNIGEPLVWEGKYKARSYPKNNKIDHPQIGWEVLKKPVVIEKVWFGGFYRNLEYDMGAIGFRIDSKLRTSPQHQFSNIKFGFDDLMDGTGGNRVVNYPPSHPYYTNEDGDDNESFKDVDGSVTGIADRTVILPHLFHLTEACINRTNWYMAICNHRYGTIRVNYGKDEKEDERDTNEVTETSTNELIMARDDNLFEAYQQHDIGTQAPFIVILGGSHSYSMHFTEQWPDQQIKIFGLAVTKTDYVRAGICIPRHSTFELLRNTPELQSTADWTEVNSLAELDNDQVGNMFFHDKDVGYLAILYRHIEDKAPDAVDECPNDICVTIRLTVNLRQESDRTDIDCFSRLKNKYIPDMKTENNLVPKNGPQIIAENSNVDDRDLPKTSNSPPSAWGAGATR